MRIINLTIEFIQNIELSSDTNYLPKIIKQKQTSDEKQEEELIIKEDNQLEKKENIFLKRLKNIKKDPIYLQDIYNYKWDKNEWVEV